MIVALLPVMPLTVSVAVTVWLPGVMSATPPLKMWTPWSLEVNV